MKERYTFLVLSLLLVVMLYGITSVLGASNWTAPTSSFPSAGSIKAPIDVGAVEQKREGIITFETSSPVATTSLDIAKRDLLIGDASSSNYFSPYTDMGPKFRSDTPITINANGYGLVLPNIANPDGDPDTKVSGNLIFDSAAKKLKLFVNDAWKTIEGGGSFWTKENDGGISYSSGPVTINNADVVVKGDIKINEPSPKVFYYFPAYNSTGTYYISNNPILKRDESRYSYIYTPLGDPINPSDYNRLPCDKDEKILDCLSSNNINSFLASAVDQSEKVDIAWFDQAKNTSILASGYYAMKYIKYPYGYNYLVSEDTNVSLSSSIKPRYFCDVDDLYECDPLVTGSTIPAPPPESGWPPRVYDWGKFSSATYTGGEKFVKTRRIFNRTLLTREQMEGLERQAISFTPSYSSLKVSISAPAYNVGANATEVLGNYSFCALGRVWSGGFTRGYCDVRYDDAASTWKVDYGAWVNSIECTVNCF
ncbi:MAG: hypothetical protein WC842_02010 [Candidatus Paceibacterota bacterium]|jgi:hypothetical protein